MTLKKDDIIFRNFEVVNIGKVKERLVYHDYCTYTEQERQDQLNDKISITKEFDDTQSSWWTLAEIFRMTNRPFMKYDGTYRGYTKHELVYLMDQWVQSIDWWLNSEEELR